MLLVDVQSIISQTPFGCIQLSGWPSSISSMLHTCYKPHITSQISWVHSYSLYIPVEYTVPFFQRVYSQSSPRYPAAVSKSPGCPVAFLACYTHPTILILLLRYLGFMVTDSIFQLNCRGCSNNHLPDTLQLYPNLWVARQHSQHATHILQSSYQFSDILVLQLLTLYFPVEYSVPSLQRVFKQSFPRHRTVVSKSLGSPVAFLACYTHPTSLISFLDILVSQLLSLYSS